MQPARVRLAMPCRPTLPGTLRIHARALLPWRKKPRQFGGTNHVYTCRASLKLDSSRSAPRGHRLRSADRTDMPPAPKLPAELSTAAPRRSLMQQLSVRKMRWKRATPSLKVARIDPGPNAPGLIYKYAVVPEDPRNNLSSRCRQKILGQSRPRARPHLVWVPGRHNRQRPWPSSGVSCSAPKI